MGITILQNRRRIKWRNEYLPACRTKIRGCDGVVVLITKNLKQADGARWEIKCAKEENVPVIGVYIGDATAGDAPVELNGIKKITWTWDGIASFVNGL